MGNSVGIECVRYQHVRDQEIVERIPACFRRPNHFIREAQDYLVAFLFGMRKDSGSQLLCNMLNDDIAKLIGKHLLLDAGWMQLSTVDLDWFLRPGVSMCKHLYSTHQLSQDLQKEMARLVYFPHSFREDAGEEPLMARRMDHYAFEKEDRKGNLLCGGFRSLPVVAWETRIYMHSLFKGWIPLSHSDLYKTHRTYVQLSTKLPTLGQTEEMVNHPDCCSGHRDLGISKRYIFLVDEPIYFEASDTHFAAWMPVSKQQESDEKRDRCEITSDVAISEHADDVLGHLAWTFRNIENKNARRSNAMSQWIGELFVLQMMMFSICNEDSLTELNLEETFIKHQHQESDEISKSIDSFVCYGYDDSETERHCCRHNITASVKLDNRTLKLSCWIDEPEGMSECFCRRCMKLVDEGLHTA